MQGTIPYLGTFLTDLVMLDTAMKDFLDVRTSISVLLLSFMPRHPQSLAVQSGGLIPRSPASVPLGIP